MYLWNEKSLIVVVFSFVGMEFASILLRIFVLTVIKEIASNFLSGCVFI
jgi:hypothetical protein